MSEKLPEFFWIIHSGLPRDGPGDNKSTRRAYRMLKDMPENPRILDVGCGPGMQTVELAKRSGGQIVALDFHEPFLEQLKESAKKEGVDDRIKAVKGDMHNSSYILRARLMTKNAATTDTVTPIAANNAISSVQPGPPMRLVLTEKQI